MDLSIIILNYKTKGLLRNCLRGLKKLSIGLDYEIIVVDNNSLDDTGVMMKNEFADIKFIPLEKNLGHAAGNNVGIKEAQGKYIMLLNTDIVIFKDSIEKAVDFMESNYNCGIIGCKLQNPDRTIQFSCLNFPSLMVPIYSRTFLGNLQRGRKVLEDYRMQNFNHQDNLEVDWVLSSCMMIRKDALDKVGLMDERFFIYFADVDLCRRFWQNNYKVYYFADSNIIHYYHRESAENKGFKVLFNSTTRIHIKDWIKYLIKHKVKKNGI